MEVIIDDETADKISTVLRTMGFSSVEEWLKYNASKIVGFDGDNVISIRTFGDRYHENLGILYKNIRIIPDNFVDVSALEGFFLGVSPLCIGGGPSIQRLNQLDKLTNNIPIVVCDRMYKSCLERGVRPTIVCSTDSSELVSEFFTGLSRDDIQGTKFVINVYGSTEIIKKLYDLGSEVFLFANSIPDVEVMNADNFILGMFQRRLSVVPRIDHVGALCWFASIIGIPKSIGLIGYDMGYGENRLSEDTEYFNDLRESKISDEGIKLIAHDCWGKGSVYLTDVIFDTFRHGMIDLIAWSSGVVTYNCTEGGCLCGKGTPADGKLVCTTLDEFLCEQNKV